MKIVIAPDSFKGTLSSQAAGQAMAAGVRRRWPNARVYTLAVADGGEGTVAALLSARRGTYLRVRVSGPLGEPRSVRIGQLAGRTFVIEMAASSGLTLVPDAERDPTRTCTHGVGEQINRVLRRRPGQIMIGLGGSATVDGGCGAAQASGVRFYDRRGIAIDVKLCGGNLDQVARVDVSRHVLHGAECRLRCLCDVDNPLCGPDGAAAVFGPQKFGGSRRPPREKLRLLARNLEHLANVIQRDLGVDVATMPSGGAAGGLAAGLHAFFGAELVSGVDTILDQVDFDRRIAGADVVITGEGRLDGQTARGKTSAGIARRARARGIPTIVIAGSIGPGVEKIRGVFAQIVWCGDSGDPPPPDSATARKALSKMAAHAVASFFEDDRGWDSPRRANLLPSAEIWPSPSVLRDAYAR